MPVFATKAHFCLPSFLSLSAFFVVGLKGNFENPVVFWYNHIRIFCLKSPRKNCGDVLLIKRFFLKKTQAWHKPREIQMLSMRKISASNLRLISMSVISHLSRSESGMRA